MRKRPATTTATARFLSTATSSRIMAMQGQARRQPIALVWKKIHNNHRDIVFEVVLLYGERK